MTMYDTALRFYPCDNCGRKHFGYMEKFESPMDFPGIEWDFVWCDYKGIPKREGRGRRYPC